MRGGLWVGAIGIVHIGGEVVLKETGVEAGHGVFCHAIVGEGVE